MYDCVSSLCAAAKCCEETRVKERRCVAGGEACCGDVNKCVDECVCSVAVRMKCVLQAMRSVAGT